MGYAPMKSSLVSDVDRLLASQATAWPMLARGLAGLRQSQTRTERVFGRNVLVRHIPHRIKSTTAAVDAVSVAQRRCFLCPGNLEPEEEGIPFGSDFIIYCNPFPILERHLTVVHVDHRPQQISGQFGALLGLAKALPDSFIIYNGPECGASAPDHLHFQSCSRAIFPIEQDLRDGYIPRVVALRGGNPLDLSSRLEGLLTALKKITNAPTEPMINIAAFFAADSWTVLVFPRGKHRPRVYETKELTVSPATIDLCGVFVVPVPGDYEKIRGVDIERIFEEVTLPAELFQSVMRSLEGVR
jgi:Domain of unknown function (DUF4922)